MPPHFHNPLVRDLAWVAASPALLDGQLLPMRDPLQDSIWRQDPGRLWHELAALDAAPHRLAELFSDSPDRRLGSHYERLWHALLTLAPDTRILAHNIALRRGAHTLGEIDLVMQAADGAIVHLELAVKFYLGRADLHDPQQHCSDPQHWWGIDTRDTLARKLERLTQHQLPLSQRLPELATAHRALPLPEVAAAWLQGGLFTPLDLPMPLPTGGLAPPKPLHWGPVRALKTLPAHSRWLQLPHKEWLMPPPADTGETLSPSAMRALCLRLGRHRVRMFCAAEDDSLSAERLLCVDDAWPA